MRSGTRRIGRFTARKRRSAGNKLIGANWRTERADAVFQRLMAEKKKFQAIKGTRDLLPPETELWNRVEQTARKVFGTFGFGEIRPPIFEPTELFARAVGGETDIVSKEMYSFEDHGWIELAQYRAALTVRSISPGLTSEFSQYERSVLSYIDILA